MVNWYLSDNVRLEMTYGYGSLNRFGLIGKTQISLIYQSRGLQSVAFSFSTHVAVGESSQLLVDDWDQLLQSQWLSLPPGQQQLRYVFAWE